MDDVIELLKRHANDRSHVILEIHIRDGKPCGAVRETQTTLVQDIKAHRLTKRSA